MQKRALAHYNREFLDAYVPNKTFYLSSDARDHLRKMGTRYGDPKPAGTYAKEISDNLLTQLAWNSSRLEGCPYSLQDVQKLFKTNIPMPETDQQIVLNHRTAIEFLIHLPQYTEISTQTIEALHKMLSNKLLCNATSCGQTRSISVKLGESTYVPLKIPQVIKESFQQLVHTAAQIQDPFEQSFFLMVHIPYLQAFEDVNKRVSRVALNIPLIRENLHPFLFVDIPYDLYINGLLGVYEFNRIELLRDVFVWGYERSCPFTT